MCTRAQFGELQEDLRAQQNRVQAELTTQNVARQQTEHLTFGEPEEVREFPHGRLELVTVGGAQIGRLVLEPGWRWSNDVKPVAGTELCEAPHMQYHVSGRIAVRMAR